MGLAGERILITGADGFIGSHLTEALVRAGAHVRAFVLYNSLGYWGWLEQAPPEVKAEIEIFPGDVRDLHRVKQAMVGIETVFHLASLIAIPYSYRSPDSYVETNVRGTLHVLQAALDADIKRFVHTSTSEVYGTAQYVPIDEKHPLSAQSPYAATKIGADQMADAFFRSYGLPVTTVRPFNTYGPRQSARAIIPTIIAQLLEGAADLKLGSLEPVRDFTFVADLVQGYLLVGEADNIEGRLVQFGYGSGVSMGELAQRLIALTGSQARIITDSRRIRPAESEVLQLVCNNSQAKELLGWQPQISLDDGLARTIEWFRNAQNMAFYKPEQYAI